jgi:hypothetical protein
VLADGSHRFDRDDGWKPDFLWTRRNTAVGKLVHPTANSLFSVNKISRHAHDDLVPKSIRTCKTEEGKRQMAKAAAKKTTAKKKAPMKKSTAKKRTAKA